MPVRGRTAPDPTLGVPPVPFDPSVPPPPDPRQLEQPTPVRIVASGRYIPELGETNASALELVFKQVAVNVVTMMEKPWSLGERPPAGR